MHREYSFKAKAGLDIIGIVMLEVKEARNLPRWKGMIGGFDMDPFAVISFGQKIYRTRVCRHTLNPVRDEKLLFHVRRYEDKFQIKAAIYDWDRISSHDYCGGASLNVADLVAKAPTPDPVTGLYASDLDFDQELGTFELPLEGVPDRDATTPGAGGGNGLALTADTIMSKLHLGSKPPTITLRAKFQPYAALRQRFWRQLLKQFDSDESGTLNFLEISSMLDSLGATLTRETIVSWFEGRGKDIDGAGGGLTFDEAIAALEGEMRKPEREKKTVAAPALSISTGGGGGESGAQTPALSDALLSTSVGGLDVGGIQAPSAADRGKGTNDKPIVVPKMSIDPPTPIDGPYAPKLGSGAEPKKTATGS